MDDWDGLDDWMEADDWEDSDEWGDADGASPGAPDAWEGEDGLHPWFDVEVDGTDIDTVEHVGDGTVDEPAGVAGADGTRAGRGAMMNPWDVGTAAAIAGWLLDRQAEQIVEGVRAAASAPVPGPPGGHGRPVRRPTPGPPVDWDAPPLHPGDVLERSRLAVTIAVRLGANRPLGLDAAPVATAGPVPAQPGLDRSALSFTIAVTRIVPDLPVWVMFDDRPRGFRAAELRSTFAGEGPAGRAYCFVAAPEEAVDAVEWGLDRYGLQLAGFRWVSGF